MNLTQEERDILHGKEGAVFKKVMQTLVLYGEALEAEKFADIEGGGHFSIPFVLPGVGPRLEMLDELAEAGLKTTYPFTLDPRAPLDFDNLGLTAEQEKVFSEMLRYQPAYDRRMIQLGLRDENGYTCTPYFQEVGNIPPQGTILAWSESSCVVFANSVLGARTNRNAAVLDILSNIAGKTPFTGLLTDQGRHAAWCVEIKTRKRPYPQLLGAAIGMRVLEDVPFITGLDRFLGAEMEGETIDYLKEMGAACAAIGAVGLYHIENVTPEAIEQGRMLLKPNHRTYVIDDRELENLMASYPIIWEDKNSKPRKCLVGCPHLSLRELHWWTNAIMEALRSEGRKRVAVETILCAAPQILAEFKKDRDAYSRLTNAKVKLSATCPEAYMNNPLCAREAVITNSNKLRAFTPARLLLDEDLVEALVSGEIRKTS